jgi:hypothetical protein
VDLAKDPMGQEDLKQDPRLCHPNDRFYLVASARTAALIFRRIMSIGKTQEAC